MICSSCPHLPQDNQADLIIHGYVDDVMEKVMEKLNIPVPTATLVCPNSKLTGTETGIT